MTDLVGPLVPAEVDLRDFGFMPLDVQRLRDSELSATPDAEAFRCAVLSWCVSWHQLPAGSLPDDDSTLARLLGFGRDLKGWKRIRAADGLRGWVKCSDGRLYHPVVAEKALEAWRGKLMQRWKTECSRIKKHNQRHDLVGEFAVDIPDFETWLSQGCLWGQPLHVPRENAAMSQGQQESVPRETGSKGQGEGQGQGQGESKPTTPSRVIPPPETPPPPEHATRKGGLCKQLRQLGIDAAPHLAAWAQLLPAYSDAEILAAAEAAREKKPGERLHLNYLVPILADRAAPRSPSHDRNADRESVIDAFTRTSRRPEPEAIDGVATRVT